jgi:hypothetical protein
MVHLAAFFYVTALRNVAKIASSTTAQEVTMKHVAIWLGAFALLLVACASGTGCAALAVFHRDVLTRI